MAQHAYEEQPYVDRSSQSSHEIKSHDSSLMRLFSDLMQETSNLVHNEVTLARAELSQKVAQVQAGVVSLVLGAVFGIPAMTVLLAAGVIGLANVDVLPLWASALIVGGAAAIVALILLMVGRQKFKANKLAPTSTADSLEEDRELMKEHTRSRRGRQ